MTDQVQAVDNAILSRRSIRHFRSDSVGLDVVERVLDVAARAPSGNNAQPWNVHVLTGGALNRLTAAVMEEFNDPQKAALHVAEFDSYPTEWRSPYNERRKKIGIDMYTILGIAKGDVAAMQRQAARNFVFFDAPVGLIFTIDRVFVPGSAVDMGMFMSNIMTAARARGLDTCPQAAWGIYHRVVSRTLDVPAEHTVLCGMSLGYADVAAPIDALKTERVHARDFAIFHS